VAYTVPYSPTFPPAHIQTKSPSTWATWSPTGWTVSMRHWVDDSFEAIVNQDLTLTPYSVEFYLEQDNADGTAVTGTRVMDCGRGTTCVGYKITGLPDVGTLVAFVDTFEYPANFPPSGIQAVSTFPYTLYN
jgi:hypothetical protein